MTRALYINYSPEENFEVFLTALREQKPAEWRWLVRHFRERAVPWIRKKDGNLPSGSIVSEKDFIEEVFSKTMVRFYEMFREGEFQNLGDLRGLVFRIAEFKLQEGYQSVKRDKRIFFDDSETGKERSDGSAEISEQKELVIALKNEMKKLPVDDRELILRYTGGERLKDIAADLNIDETSCRMRKYRAMKRLKELVKKINI